MAEKDHRRRLDEAREKLAFARRVGLDAAEAEKLAMEELSRLEREISGESEPNWARGSFTDKGRKKK